MCHLEVMLIYSVKFFTVLFLCDNYLLYGKGTAKPALLVLLFLDAQVEIQAKHLTGMGGEKNLFSAPRSG